MNPVNPKKLLLSKWTAVAPANREKHFVVTALVEPETADAAPELVELEAVHSRRTRRIAWRALRDSAVWRQGWT
ncbi:MAG TPA: TIGR02450 family Trp-rich protein [Telluria sp.]